MAKLEGIVIKEMKYKDNSKILTVFTREEGKVTVMAKGACNPKSRLISNTELFFHNSYQLYRGKTFYYINDTDTINSFYSIREDMDRLMYGSYFLELVDLGLIEGGKNERIFDLVLRGLDLLSGLDEDFINFVLAYELKFISFLGYRPNLRACTSCDKKESDSWYFSTDEGGIICRDCLYRDRYAKSISREERDYLLELLFSPLDKLDHIKKTREMSFKLHKFMVKYILDKLDRRRFKSLEMYKTILLEEVDGCGY